MYLFAYLLLLIKNIMNEYKRHELYYILLNEIIYLHDIILIHST